MRQLLAGFLASVAAAAFGAPEAVATQSITGRLVDAACYELDKSNIGTDHRMPQGDTKNCAVACVKTGLPVGLLTSDGRVYIVTGALAGDNNAKLLRYMSQTVTLTGNVTGGAGTFMLNATDLRIGSK